jgi:hypothetical protein
MMVHIDHPNKNHLICNPLDVERKVSLSVQAISPYQFFAEGKQGILKLEG